MSFDLAISSALSGASNEDCVRLMFDAIPEAIKNGDSDRLAKHLSIQPRRAHLPLLARAFLVAVFVRTRQQ